MSNKQGKGNQLLTYPKEGGQVCVEGVFDTYKEGELTYCTLRDAKLV